VREFVVEGVGTRVWGWGFRVVVEGAGPRVWG
jgi:hypothetical protein